MDNYREILEWLIANEDNEDLTPSMLAHKASRLANEGYTILDGELVPPRKKTIGFHKDTDHEDFG